ncbi:biotin synthase [Rhizophlyctis rosea]|uniref:Biotin synthase n=1 Tax=Rhizophlyctis rosea TaxID=64517 RepID=A0AAD5X0H9_9FUNG|nr:biotin synthase [Rhizophlyctis rosea]
MSTSVLSRALPLRSLCRATATVSRTTTPILSHAQLTSTRRISSSSATRFASIDTTSDLHSTSSIPVPPTPRTTQTAAEQHATGQIRYDWTKEEIKRIYHSPLMDLLFHAAKVHRLYHDPLAVQQCTLLSIKTGGCQEDCAYCPQSSKHKTAVKATKLLPEDEVLVAARAAKEAGSSRFCMGAAWRDLNGRKSNFKDILNYVKEIRGMGMEVCCTLGMLSPEQARQLKEAGLTAYNHNLDSSREYYPKLWRVEVENGAIECGIEESQLMKRQIITTRSYDERLQTIANVREAGISVCSGGIIGLGEQHEDRVGLLHTLATLPEHPESVPVNALLAVQGTPLEGSKPVEIWEMIRMIATARIIMPGSMIRLSAGRVKFSQPEQSLCFMAGANSIFTGDKLLTTPNNAYNDDQAMFDTLGLTPKVANFRQGSDKFLPEVEVVKPSGGGLVIEG